MFGKIGSRAALIDSEYGFKMPLRKVGEGYFARVYLTDDGGTPYIVSLMKREATSDKEILAMAHEAAPGNPHLPAIERLGTVFTRRGTPIGPRVVTGSGVYLPAYVMPVYRAPLRKADSPEAWAQFKTIYAAGKKAFHEVRGPRFSGYLINHRMVEMLEGKIPRPLHEALKILMDTASNFGESQVFEIAARNLATDDRGNLVLIDPLFDRSAL